MLNLLIILVFDVNSWEPVNEHDINPTSSLNHVLTIDGELAHENPSCPQIDRIKQALQTASTSVKNCTIDLVKDEEYVLLFECHLKRFMKDVIQPNNIKYINDIIMLLSANKKAKTFLNQSIKQLFQIFQNKKLSDYKAQSEHLLNNFLVKIKSIEGGGEFNPKRLNFSKFRIAVLTHIFWSRSYC
ncbi:MAG: hypothetical protein ACR2HS_01480 [Gammaproteobacteria bacterium]